MKRMINVINRATTTSSSCPLNTTAEQIRIPIPPINVTTSKGMIEKKFSSTSPVFQDLPIPLRRSLHDGRFIPDQDHPFRVAGQRGADVLDLIIDIELDQCHFPKISWIFAYAS